MENNTVAVDSVVGSSLDSVVLVSVELEKLGEVLGEYKPYDSQLPIAEIEGTRIVKCLYQKSTKGANAGTKARDNTYVRVPTKHLTEEIVSERIAELTPYVITWLQAQEDELIKADHKAGLLSVYCDGLSLDKIIEKLELAEQGARLTKDKITAWFNDEVKEDLLVLFAVKMNLSDDPSSDELDKLAVVLAAYQRKFESLASGKCSIAEEDCLAMIKVVRECDADKSLIGSRFVAKLDKMSKVEEVLLSL